MNFVRIGCRIIDLDHVLLGGGHEPGCLRLHMTSGRVVDLDGQETADLRAALDRLVSRADGPAAARRREPLPCPASKRRCPGEPGEQATGASPSAIAAIPTIGTG
jgi:hypothetical protein